MLAPGVVDLLVLEHDQRTGNGPVRKGVQIPKLSVIAEQAFVIGYIYNTCIVLLYFPVLETCRIGFFRIVDNIGQPNGVLSIKARKNRKKAN